MLSLYNLNISMNIILECTDATECMAYKCVLYGLQACSQCQLSTHGEKAEMLSSAVDFTHSAPIPQPHLSSHDLMSWNRVQPSRELFLLVLSAACTIFPGEILQPARDTAEGARKQLGGGINDLQVHICYNTNTGGGNREQDLMTSLMLPQITPWSSTMYGSG